MSVEKLEFPVWFPDEELGFKADDPALFNHPLLRTVYAFSLVGDLKKRDAYLDFGSGCGFTAELLAPAFKTAIGVERRPEARAYAAKVHGRGGVRYSDRLPMGISFDFITAMEVIEHMNVEDGRKLIETLVGMLEPEGTLFLTTPVAYSLDGTSESNPYHIHEYQPAEIKGLLIEFFDEVSLMAPLGRGMYLACRGKK